MSETIEQTVRRPDGKFVGGGLRGIGTLNQDVIASLFNEDGTLIGTDKIDFSSYDVCVETLAQTDGKFLVIGSYGGDSFSFFVVRYLNITP